MIKRAVTLTLSQGHLWLIIKGLAMLTSEEGEQAILREFPEADLDAMSQDISQLCIQIEKAQT